jgi:AcrR family transcriptional regulator
METRQKIIQAAHGLFIHYGYDHVSLRQIADEAGLTKGGIYHHFESKEELLREVMSLVASQMDSWVDITTHEDQGTRENLRSIIITAAPMVDTYFRSLPGEEGIGHYRLLFDALSRFPHMREQFVQSSSRFISKMEDFLESGRARGEIEAVVDWETVAFAVAALIEGMSLIYAIYPSIDLARMSEQTFELLWNGLSP